MPYMPKYTRIHMEISSYAGLMDALDSVCENNMSNSKHFTFRPFFKPLDMPPHIYADLTIYQKGYRVQMWFPLIPQTLWHRRTNYGLRPLTYSLWICCSISIDQKGKLLCWLTQMKNNNSELPFPPFWDPSQESLPQLGHPGLFHPSPTSDWVDKSQGSKFHKNCNQLALTRSCLDSCGSQINENTSDSCNVLV